MTRKFVQADPLTFDRVSTWDPFFVEVLRDHYTGSRGAPPGKKLAWVVFWHAARIAVLGLGEPAFKLAPRRRLGLADARPLPFTVSNFIYRRVSVAGPSGSKILRAWHPIASDEWEREYGWRPAHWETLVLPSAVRSAVAGAVFRRAGYRSLGMTTGRSARRPPGATHAARVWSDSEPKLVLVPRAARSDRFRSLPMNGDLPRSAASAAVVDQSLAHVLTELGDRGVLHLFAEVLRPEPADVLVLPPVPVSRVARWPGVVARSPEAL